MTKWFYLLAALTWAVGGPAQARPPHQVLEESNDRIHRFQMDNGMTGLIKPDRSAPVVAIELWFGTGSMHEDDLLGAGMAHYVEHMIFKGTPTQRPGDITRTLNDAGARVNAYASLDRTVFHLVMPAEHWETGLAVFSDAVIHAAFPEDEWQDEQTVILQEMKMGRDDPNRELGALLRRTAYRVHPYRHPVIGYEELFLQTTREDLLSFYHRHYTPENLIFVLVGDVDPTAAEQAVRAAFAPFERRLSRPVVIPSEPPQMAPRVERKTGAYQIARASWGFHTVAIHHPDAAALDVLAALVGWGQSARLTTDLRDRQRLVHSISAWSFTPGDPGLFGLTAQFEPEQEAALIEAVAQKIERWREELFEPEELDRARRQMLMSSISSLQDMQGQARSMASGEFYARDPRFTERYLQRLEAITPETLRTVAQRYLRPENLSLVLLIPEQPEETVAPAEDDPLLGEPVRLTLSNGIPLIVREDHRLPLTHVSIALLGGVLSETPDRQGITRLMADLLPRGTSTADARELAGRMDALGASLQPFSGLNSFGLEGTSLAEDLPALLAQMAEILLDPAFPEHELDRQRARQIASLRAAREQPMNLADQLVRAALHPGEHPYQWTPLGSEEALAALDRAALQAHLARHLNRDNIAIAVFGHCTPEEALALVEPLFADMPAGDRMASQPPSTPTALPAREERREPRQQTIYMRGFPGVDLRDERVDALNLLQTALSGLSSELSTEVREKRGMAYFVGARNLAGLAPGRFYFYAGTYEEAVAELDQLIDAEIQRIVTDGLSEQEFLRAQAQLLGDSHSRLQDNASLAQMATLNELYGMGYRYGFDHAARIRQVTNEAVRAAARSLLDPDRQITVVIYPEQNDNAR